nr:signal peptidase I [Aeromicrobium duanguangcaii]
MWAAAVLGALSLVLALATVVAGVQPLIFRSSSMAPAVDAGALALAKTVDAQQVEPGDIVSVVNSDGVRVTHRVVKVDQGAGDQVSLTLKGDSNRSPDEEPYLVTEVDRVVADVPYLGYVADWLASPWAMFAAGIVAALLVVNLWSRWSRSDGGAGLVGAGSGASAVVLVALVVASVTPVPRTEAYFSDPATVEAGTVHSHDVQIFDWDTTPCTTNDDGSVTLRYKVVSPSYDMTWYRGPKNGTISDAPFLTITPPSSQVGDVVETRIDRTTLAAGEDPFAQGTYVVAGRSQLKGSATEPWLSSSHRYVEVTADATTVRCGDINLPPTVEVTAPRDGREFGSQTAAELEVAAACSGRRAPCGTTTDTNGIYSVEYRLQRENWLGTQCWDPKLDAILPPGYYAAGCGEWRPAYTDPQAPTTDGSTVKWRIPIGDGGPGTTFNQSGTYTLYVRITDNASPTREVTEHQITFTVD